MSSVFHANVAFLGSVPLETVAFYVLTKTVICHFFLDVVLFCGITESEQFGG